MLKWGQRKWARTQQKRAHDRSKLMPMQIQCDICGCRPFYLMAQDDGSIESFCANVNHRKVLVDIPALVSHIAKGYEEDLTYHARYVLAIHAFLQEKGLLDAWNERIDSAHSKGGTANVEVQDERATNPPGVQHGAPSNPDLQNAGGDSTRSGFHGGVARKKGQQASRNKVRGSRKR